MINLQYIFNENNDDEIVQCVKGASNLFSSLFILDRNQRTTFFTKMVYKHEHLSFLQTMSGSPIHANTILF